MGYYTDIYIDAPLRDGITAEQADQHIRGHFAQRIAAAANNEELCVRTREWEAWDGMLQIDRSIFFADALKLWDDEVAELAAAMAPLVTDGWHLSCQGEDHDDTWAIEFASGSWRMHEEHKYFGTAYEHFLTQYGDLPPDLKAALAQWWQTRKNLSLPEVS